MIKLDKAEEPEVLRDNASAWLKNIQDKIDNGETPTESDKSKYRHVDIKAALIDETHGKCAYCESYVRHIAFGDVEHIHPKSQKLEDTFRWDNLTLACDICNTAKSNSTGVLDPYCDDPSQHFKFLGPMIYANAASVKAVFTEKKLKLNRAELISQRAKRLSAISNIILLIEKEEDQNLKKILIEDLFENEVASSTEYSAFTSGFLQAIIRDMNLSNDNE